MLKIYLALTFLLFLGCTRKKQAGPPPKPTIRVTLPHSAVDLKNTLKMFMANQASDWQLDLIETEETPEDIAKAEAELSRRYVHGDIIFGPSLSGYESFATKEVPNLRTTNHLGNSYWDIPSAASAPPLVPKIGKIAVIPTLKETKDTSLGLISFLVKQRPRRIVFIGAINKNYSHRISVEMYKSLTAAWKPQVTEVHIPANENPTAQLQKLAKTLKGDEWVFFITDAFKDYIDDLKDSKWKKVEKIFPFGGSKLYPPFPANIPNRTWLVSFWSPMVRYPNSTDGFSNCDFVKAYLTEYQTQHDFPASGLYLPAYFYTTLQLAVKTKGVSPYDDHFQSLSTIPTIIGSLKWDANGNRTDFFPTILHFSDSKHELLTSGDGYSLCPSAQDADPKLSLRVVKYSADHTFKVEDPVR